MSNAPEDYLNDKDTYGEVEPEDYTDWYDEFIEKKRLVAELNEFNEDNVLESDQNIDRIK